MAQPKKILIVGTGTIGGSFLEHATLFADSGFLLCEWDELMFTKKEPRREDLDKIENFQQLTKKGMVPHFCVHDENFEEFLKAGYNPRYKFSEALERADIVFDVTDEGGQNKARYYDRYTKSGKFFVAEGSEGKAGKNFGDIFIHGVNESAILRKIQMGQRFFVVGSCNTHAIARNLIMIFRTFADLGSWDMRIFVEILRRSADPNQDKVHTAFGFAVPNEKYREKGGTYHTDNALSALVGMGYPRLQLRARVTELSDHFMHGLLWRVHIAHRIDDAKERFLRVVENDLFVARTRYLRANKVYQESKGIKRHDVQPWYEKDCCFAHTIVCEPTISVDYDGDETILEYATFTPQDRNVVVANLAMACMVSNPSAFTITGFNTMTAPLFEPRKF